MSEKQDSKQVFELELQPVLAQNNLSCSIDQDDIVSRKELMNSISANLESRVSENDKAILSFPYTKELSHTILDFVLLEQQCCSFFNFDLQFRKQEKEIRFVISSDQLDGDDLEKTISMMID